jgi:tetratricopeptide (TPR) repeat protein
MRRSAEASNPEEKKGKGAETRRKPVAPEAREAGASAPRQDQRDQTAWFEKAVALFHARRFEQAKALFEKAAAGPALEVAHAARVHIRMCEQRLNPSEPKPSSAEEHYAYAVALINQRELETAEKHLVEAARLAPDADHVYYALALCRGLRGDYEGAGAQLRRAIELQPQNRYLARRDPDFSGFVHQPPLERILWPERFERG